MCSSDLSLLDECGLGADLRAPILNRRPNFISNLPRPDQLLVVGAGNLRWIGKAPVQAFGWSGKDWTLLSTGFVTHSDDVSKELPGLEYIEDRPRFLFGNIDADLAHHFHRERIERVGFEASALRFEKLPTNLIEPCLRYLTARAVVHANEEHFRFH